MSVQPSEKKAVSPVVVGVALAVVALGGVAVWRLGFQQNPTVADAAPPGVASAPTERPPTEAPPTEARRTARLRAATMELPKGPLLRSGKATEPLDQSRGGTATRAGRLFRLDVGREALGGAGLVCLDAPESATALGGVQATCKPLDGWPAERVLCGRNDEAKAVELTGTVTWRLPCP